MLHKTRARWGMMKKATEIKIFAAAKRCCLCGSEWLLQRHSDDLNLINSKSGSPTPAGIICKLKGMYPRRRGSPLCEATELLPGGGASLVCLLSYFFQKDQNSDNLYENLFTLKCWPPCLFDAIVMLSKPKKSINEKNLINLDPSFLSCPQILFPGNSLSCKLTSQNTF